MTKRDDDLLEEFLRGENRLNDLYRDASDEQPPAQLDQAILAQAKEAVEVAPVKATQRPKWLAPMALAATLMLGLNLAFNLKDFAPPSERVFSGEGEIKAPPIGAPSNDAANRTKDERYANAPAAEKVFDAAETQLETAEETSAELPLQDKIKKTQALASERVESELASSISTDDAGFSIGNSASDATEPGASPEHDGQVSQGTAQVETVIADSNQSATQFDLPMPVAEQGQNESTSRPAVESRNTDMRSDDENFAVAPTPETSADTVSAAPASVAPAEIIANSPPVAPTPRSGRRYTGQASTSAESAELETVEDQSKEAVIKSNPDVESSGLQEVVVTGSRIVRDEPPPFPLRAPSSRTDPQGYPAGADSRENVESLDHNADPVQTSASTSNVQSAPIDRFTCQLEDQGITNAAIEEYLIKARTRFDPPLNANTWLVEITDLADKDNYFEACTSLAAYYRLYENVVIPYELPVQLPEILDH